jgi:hypothetical protein
LSAATDSLALLERIAVACEKLVTIAERRQQSRPASGNASAIASDRDLDGPHGNPTVKFDPRDWSGPSQKLRPFSECPPDFLDVLARAFDDFAAKAEREGDEKKARFNRLDGSRARGWAARIRSGKHQAASLGDGGGATAQGTGGDDPWAVDPTW